MKRTGSVLLLGGAIIGYLGGYATNRSGATQPQVARDQGGQAFYLPDMPSLLPDSPTKPQYWNSEDVKKIHAARIAKGGNYAGSNRADFPSPPFRTHRQALNTRRADSPNNAEQHQGVTDYYIYVGGSGKIVVDGEIENRRYVDTGGGLFLLGEFRGPSIKGGQVYTVKAGDVMVIPPNTPHQSQPGPDGVTYLLTKIQVGFYPWSLSR